MSATAKNGKPTFADLVSMLSTSEERKARLLAIHKHRRVFERWMLARFRRVRSAKAIRKTRLH